MPNDLPNDIFISYRRARGGETAHRLHDKFKRDAYTVSLDTHVLRSGPFPRKLLELINGCTDFVLILSEDVFDKTMNPKVRREDDWLRIELAYALRKNKNVIPIRLKNFKGFPDGLPSDIVRVTKLNYATYREDQFDDFCAEFEKKYLHSSATYKKILRKLFKWSFLFILDAIGCCQRVSAALGRLKWAIIVGVLLGGLVGYLLRVSGVLEAVAERFQNNVEPTRVENNLHQSVSLYSQPFRIPELDLEMLPIQATSFLMGSPTNESERSSDETQHRVTLTKSFWLGKYPVTQRQWEAVMRTNVEEQAKEALEDDAVYASLGNKRWREFFGYDKGTNSAEIAGMRDANHPIVFVSWEEAKLFCDRLTRQERAIGRLPDGYEYTLPTEAQWEYACRAGTTTPFNTGDNLTTAQANYNGERPYNGNAKGEWRKFSTKVGSFHANAWGLYDMHGNVMEWCLDWCDAYPSGAVTDPIGLASGNYRIFRGGSWRGDAGHCRSASRLAGPPGFRSGDIGFRLALSSVGK